jgi:hypothetical protein
MTGKRSLAVCALLIAATAALYAPVLGYEFVRFDDPRYVSENPYIAEGLTSRTVAWSFTTAHRSNWHPLTWLSHALDLELYGGDAGGHHATNVALHVLNVLLLFGVLRSMTGQVWRSGFVAALFALHPLHVESVAWISERKDVLSTMFGLLSMWAYVRYTRLGGDKRQLISVGLLLLGLLAKPMLVTLPLVFLLLDYWPLNRLRAGRLERRELLSPQPSRESEVLSAPGQQSFLQLLKDKVPFLAVAAAVCLITVIAQRGGGATRASDLVPLPLRVANAVTSYVRYMAKMVWPTDLAIHYPHPNLPAAGGVPWAAWQIAGAGLVLVVISVLVIRFHRRRYLLVGWLWYLGMLVPVIGIVQVGMQAMADRYTYLPIVGLFIAITWGVGDAVAVLRRRVPLLRLLLVPVAMAVLSVYAAVSWSHLPTWRNSVTLFEQALAVSPTDTIMLNNLGNELGARGRLEEGILQYRRALQIAPGYINARDNLRDALEAKAERDGVE